MPGRLPTPNSPTAYLDWSTLVYAFEGTGFMADAPRRELRVRKSWDSDTTKDREAAVLPIARGLRPHLEAAFEASVRGALLFPRSDGTMYRRDVSADDILRRALGRAGIVVGFEHRCRRHGCGYREMMANSETGACPKCNFQLWAKPIPRHVRFHDLRHYPACRIIPRHLVAGLPRRHFGAIAL